MKSLTKKILVILASVIALGVIAALPGFCETQDELKDIFVTREEVNFWIYDETVGSYQSSTNYSNATSTSPGYTVAYIVGMSDQIKNLENRMQQTVQSMVKIEMSTRGIRESTTASAASP